MSAVRVLVAARDADSDAFRGSEPALVEAARIHSMPDLQRVFAYCARPWSAIMHSTATRRSERNAGFMPQ